MPETAAHGCVLVVEDQVIQRFVGDLLGRDGRLVVEAGIEEALRALRHGAVEISLLVTNAPAKFLEFAENLPLIYMAACPDPGLAKRFRACRVLRKPFRPSELSSCAAELIPPGRE